MFLIGLSTSLQAQKPYFTSKDWFYFGVSAGASWDILYDWSFSWNDPIDVDKVGQGIMVRHSILEIPQECQEEAVVEVQQL